MMVRPPLKIPDAPRPATALPITNTADEGATPQMSDPSSKMTTAKMKNHLMEKDW